MKRVCLLKKILLKMDCSDLTRRNAMFFDAALLNKVLPLICQKRIHVFRSFLANGPRLNKIVYRLLNEHTQRNIFANFAMLHA